MRNTTDTTPAGQSEEASQSKAMLINIKDSQPTLNLL